MRWYEKTNRRLDGHLPSGQPFDQYFHLILNVAVGGDYLEDPKPTTQWDYPGAEMWVDYVKVYPLEVVDLALMIFLNTFYVKH